MSNKNLTNNLWYTIRSHLSFQYIFIIESTEICPEATTVDDDESEQEEYPATQPPSSSVDDQQDASPSPVVAAKRRRGLIKVTMSCKITFVVHSSLNTISLF